MWGLSLRMGNCKVLRAQRSNSTATEGRWAINQRYKSHTVAAPARGERGGGCSRAALGGGRGAQGPKLQGAARRPQSTDSLTINLLSPKCGGRGAAPRWTTRHKCNHEA